MDPVKLEKMKDTMQAQPLQEDRADDYYSKYEETSYMSLSKVEKLETADPEVLEKLKQSKRHKEDSESYVNVKDAVQRHYDQMQNLFSEKSLSEQIEAIQEGYQGMIKACGAYLASHKSWCFTSVGRERRRMIRRVKESSERESALLFNAINIAREQHPEDIENMKWGDIISRYAIIDTVKVTDPSQYKQMGEAMSTVYRVKRGSGRYIYFKEDSDASSGNNFLRQYEDDWLDRLNQDKTLTSSQRANRFLTRQSVKKNLGLSEETPDSYENSLLAGTAGTRLLIANINLDRAGLKGKEKDERLRESAVDTLERIVQKLRSKKEKEETAKGVESFINQLRTNQDVWDDYRDLLLATTRNDQTKRAAERAGLKDQNNLSKRNIATSLMADILGVGDIVTRTTRMELEINNKKMYGYAMEEAKGYNIDSLPTNILLNMEVSPRFIQKLNQLQVLDWINGQIDRHLNNYILDVRQIEAHRYLLVGLKGIDNDDAFGARTEFQKTQLPGLLNKSNKFALSMLDRDMAERILGMTSYGLLASFGKLLSKDEMKALITRMKNVRDQLVNKKEEDDDTDGAGYMEEMPQAEFLEDVYDMTGEEEDELYELQQQKFFVSGTWTESTMRMALAKADPDSYIARFMKAFEKDKEKAMEGKLNR